MYPKEVTSEEKRTMKEEKIKRFFIMCSFSELEGNFNCILKFQTKI
jgi:hypothetical protein